MRVVSLVPSVTETLLDWGVDVAACTRFCEQPAIRQVGGTKDPAVAAIVELRPDLVVLDTEENRLPDHDALVGAGLRVLVTSVTSVATAGEAVAALAEAVGVEAPEPAVFGRAPVPVTVRAFVPIWRRPWMTVNAQTYLADALLTAGVRTVFADHPERYPTVGDDEVAAARPDRVVAPDEPYPFRRRHQAELERFAPATIIDGKLVTWWGSRTGERLRELAALLSPPTPRSG